MKILLFLLLTSLSTYSQVARPTYNPFNNGVMPFYGGNQFMMPNQGFNFPNNTNHPLNFHRPNNFGFQNNFQRPQQFFPQSQPQQNWQQPQTQPQQPQPQQPAPPTMFTRRFHLNNGYLFGRPTLYLDPKTGKMQPWVRKNLR
jgi:hypothetical protein